MKCPKCESENTQRLEVAFSSGTQNIKTTGASIGGAHGGAFGIGGAVTKTSGQTQSLLAQQVAPPEKKSLMWPGIGVFIGVMILNSSNWQAALIMWGLAIAGISGFLLYSRTQYNSKEWPGLYQHWSESWLCHKCGGVYHQPA